MADINNIQNLQDLKEVIAEYLVTPKKDALTAAQLNIILSKSIDFTSDTSDIYSAINNIAAGSLGAIPSDTPVANINVYKALATGTYGNMGGLTVSTEDLAAGDVQLVKGVSGNWLKRIVPNDLLLYPKKVDLQYKDTFDSVALAIAGVPSSQRKLGDTVGIKENGSVVEYWWKEVLTNEGLVVKSGVLGAIYPFNKVGTIFTKLAVGISDISLFNADSNRIYYLRFVYANTSNVNFQIVVWSCLPDLSDAKVFASIVSLRSSTPVGSETYLLSGGGGRVTVDFSKLLALEINYTGQPTSTTDFHADVFKGGRTLDLPSTTLNNNKLLNFPFNKNYNKYFYLTKIVKGLRDLSLKNTEAERIYYIKYLYAPPVSDRYQFVIRSCNAQGLDERAECGLVVLSSTLSEIDKNKFTTYNLTSDVSSTVTGKVIINFGILEALNTSHNGAPMTENYWHEDVFNGGGVYLRSSIDKMSQLTNDVGFSTGAEIDQKLGGYVTSQALTTGYRNNAQIDTLISEFVTNQVLNTKVFNNANLAPQAVTADKIALSVWAQMTGGNVNITNQPDNEDLETAGSLLRLKEREPVAGKYGYKKERNVLITQAIVNTWENCIVELTKEHAFTGGNIILPDNVTLYFNGGSVTTTNRVTSTRTVVMAPSNHYIFRNMADNMRGLWMPHTSVFFEWFGSGIIEDGIACQIALNAFVGSEFVFQKGKTYVLNSGLTVTGGSVVKGYGSNIERSGQIAINVTSAITINESTYDITLEDNPTELAKLKVGHHLAIVNREGATRKVDYGRKTITAINGNVISIRGNTNMVGWAANTASIVNLFSLFQLDGVASKLLGLVINARKELYTHTRTYWEMSGCIYTNTGSRNTEVSECIITNSLSDGITSGGINSVVKHNFISHSGSNSVHLSGSQGGHIEGNYFFDSNLRPYTGHNEGAITFSNVIYNVRIINNIFDTCYSGIASLDSSDNSKVLIAGNVFKNFAHSGVQSYCPLPNNINNIDILGNRFYGTRRLDTPNETPYLPTGPEQTILEGRNAISFSGDGGFKNIKVQGNTFIDCVTSMINIQMLNNTGNTYWEDAIVITENVANTLITLGNCDGVFSNNVIRSMGQPKRARIFLVVNCPDLLITDCYIKTDKIVIDSTSNNCKITNSRINGKVILANKISIKGGHIAGQVTVGVVDQDNTKLSLIDVDFDATSVVTVTSFANRAVVKDNYLYGVDIIDNSTDTLKINNTIM